MSRVRKDERGFTLIELLVTMSVGMIVMAGILGLLDMTLRGSTTSLGRTHAVREGRGAIDRVGQELRLASCPDTGSAVISADGDTVSYYVARPLSNPQLAPVVERHTLTYTAANGTIALTVSPGTGTPPVWSGTPSRRAILGTGLSRTGTTPIFQYLSYDAPDASAMSLITAPVPAASLIDDRAGPRDLHRARCVPERRQRELALPERRRTADRRPLRRGQHARMLILRNLLQRLRREDGFTMMLVVGTMAVVVVVVGVVLSDVQGDFKPGRKDEDRKVAYAAAEAGIADYQARLESNPSYWAQCVDANNPSLGQVGTKNFVSMPGSSAQYAIELLPTTGHTSCSTSDASSMVSGAGEFRIRVTGRPRAGDTTQRQIVATFRPKGFLNYIYYTDYETLDPKLYSFVTKGATTTSTSQGDYLTWATNNCGTTRWPARGSLSWSGKFGSHEHDGRLLGDPVRPQRQGLRPVPHERLRSWSASSRPSAATPATPSRSRAARPAGAAPAAPARPPPARRSTPCPATRRRSTPRSGRGSWPRSATSRRPTPRCTTTRRRTTASRARRPSCSTART